MRSQTIRNMTFTNIFAKLFLWEENPEISRENACKWKRKIKELIHSIKNVNLKHWKLPPLQTSSSDISKRKPSLQTRHKSIYMVRKIYKLCSLFFELQKLASSLSIIPRICWDSSCSLGSCFRSIPIHRLQLRARERHSHLLCCQPSICRLSRLRSTCY